MTDCKLWTAYTDKDGYGKRSHRGRTTFVHRLAYVEAKGIELDDIKGLCICHHCDTPACYNPDHLFLGTNKDNVNDRQSKGRGNAPKGEQHRLSKLTRIQISEIRDRYVPGVITQRQLANEYGVDPSTISLIITNKRWRQR